MHICILFVNTDPFRSIQVQEIIAYYGGNSCKMKVGDIECSAAKQESRWDTTEGYVEDVYYASTCFNGLPAQVATELPQRFATTFLKSHIFLT